MDWSQRRQTFNLNIGIVQTTKGVVDEIAHSLRVGDPGLGVLFKFAVLGQESDNVAIDVSSKTKGKKWR